MEDSASWKADFLRKLSADAVKVSLFVASGDVDLQAVTVAFSAGAQNKNREIVFESSGRTSASLIRKQQPSSIRIDAQAHRLPLSPGLSMFRLFISPDPTSDYPITRCNEFSSRSSTSNRECAGRYDG